MSTAKEIADASSAWSLLGLTPTLLGLVGAILLGVGGGTSPRGRAASSRA